MIILQNNTVKLEGRIVGHIKCDDHGYFYRPVGWRGNGPHNPDRDGDHFPSVDAVMQSLRGDTK